MAQATIHQVQWCILHHPTRSRSDLYPRRKRTGESHGAILHGQCPNHEKDALEDRHTIFWRRKRSVSMDKGTGQPDFLEVLRQTSVRSTSGKHAWSWFRTKRRRICTTDLFRRTPPMRRRYPANLSVPVNKTTCKYRNQIT